MERVKMPRSERAKQFMPFDALKGLKETLKLKEYEHEKISLGDMSEEEIMKISNTLKSLQKNDIVYAEYFNDGHILKIQGISKLEYEKQIIKIDNIPIPLNSLLKLKKM